MTGSYPAQPKPPRPRKPETIIPASLRGVYAEVVAKAVELRDRGLTHMEVCEELQGTHAPPDVVGRVTRLCLSLGVVPVFVPPRQPGFQAIREGYNGTWQAQAWARFVPGNLAGLPESRRCSGGWRTGFRVEDSTNSHPSS